MPNRLFMVQHSIRFFLRLVYSVIHSNDRIVVNWVWRVRSYCLPIGSYPFATKQKREIQQGRQ